MNASQAIENIKRAASIIREGGLVAFPTETVYGLGADALNPMAVSGIFEAKDRPFFDPLIVHIASMSSLDELVEKPKRVELEIMKKFWPGPLTIVLPKKDIVPDIVTAGLDTVAIRMPSHEFSVELINETGRPIAAPSANLFGHISPTLARHVQDQLGDKVDMILDGGRCNVGVESTIIKVNNNNEVLILRHGGLPVEELEKQWNVIDNRDSEKLKKGSKKPESPGQLPYHYSPRTPLKIIDNVDSIETIERIENKDNINMKKRKTGLLAFTAPEKNPCDKIEILSKDGCLREAAANLFSCLHQLDAMGLGIIYAEGVPVNGLGRAIMDRLNKAEKRKNYK